MSGASSEKKALACLPRHIAIVMDGNGRWAEQRGFPRYAGHRAGARALRRIVEHCADRGVAALTVFAFSSENWQRPPTEVSMLLRLFRRTLRIEVGRLAENGVRLSVIGDRSAFPAELRDEIHRVEALTARGSRLSLQIAANYGGRWDIAQAARQLAQAVYQGGLDPDAVDEDRLAGALSLAGQPALDLFIRTGGEIRLSNFLLWQAAYAELYFTPRLWPDFGIESLEEALAVYATRQRRFGLTGDQVASGSVSSLPC
ncbi:MAG: polyprenyl diphosphate synthase [Pseudomonadota bacterium]